MQAQLDLASMKPEDLLAAVEAAGSQRAFCREFGVPRRTLGRWLDRARSAQFTHRPVDRAFRIDVDRGVKRFILTSAQDSTLIHEDFLCALEAYRDWLGHCEIMIAGVTYNKRLFEDHGKKKPAWPDRIKPYMRWERIRFGDKVDFCAEMNTRPTAKQPLTGFETYTRHRWGIFPHAKVQLRSIPTMKHEPAKIIMTTGSVTLPNYVPLRAGIEAQFHHVIGAVLVEMDEDGVFFCRHLLAEEDGSFYDLDRRITPAGVTEGHRVAAINHGDIHVAQIDPVVSAGTWGIYPTEQIDRDGRRIWKQTSGPTMVDTLRPSFQFFHDSFDHRRRNHHNLRDPHHMFDLFVNGEESVQTECEEVAMFLTMTKRPWCESVVVESNHDLALKRWLREADYRNDPQNALFFLRCQTAMYEAIARRDHDFSIFEHVMTSGFAAWPCEDVRFLRTDESFRVFDIEKGMHGHNGANGSRGSLHQFARMGPKSTTGHTHSAGIQDGAYMAGVKGKLDMGYNIGLSSWSHSDVITLANGKRQIVTWQDGKWRL